MTYYWIIYTILVVALVVMMAVSLKRVEAARNKPVIKGSWGADSKGTTTYTKQYPAFHMPEQLTAYQFYQTMEPFKTKTKSIDAKVDDLVEAIERRCR